MACCRVENLGMGQAARTIRLPGIRDRAGHVVLRTGMIETCSGRSQGQAAVG